MGPAGPDRTKSADFAADPRGPSGLMSGRVWSGRASLVEFSYHKANRSFSRRLPEDLRHLLTLLA